MMKCKKVAFINGKGGCGKTTSIFHVAGILSESSKVLVIDLDKQRNTTDILLMENDEPIQYTIFDYFKGNVSLDKVIKKAYFKTRGNANPKYYNVDVVPSDVVLEDESQLKGIEVKENFERYIKDNNYDWVIIDMPPSNKTLNEICFSQLANNVIVPFSSDVFSVSGYGDLMNTVNKAREINSDLNILGIYLSRYMGNCAVDKYIKEQLLQFGSVFIDIQIPLRSDIREAVMFGRPINYYKQDQKSKSIVAYKKLVEYMESKINDIEKEK